MPRVVRLGFGRATIQREVDEELAFHLQMRTEQLVAAGLSAEDAHREAVRQFGNLPGVRQLCVTMDQERVRVMKRANLFDDLRQDLGYAARMLRRNFGMTVVIVFTLALGIGANTAIFTLVNAVLLRKLPVRLPDELVVLGNPSRVTSMSFSTGPRADLFSYKGYTELRDRNKLASRILASGRVDRLEVRLDGKSGEPSRPRGRFVSGNYFSLLGVPAMLGRTFDGSEDRTSGGSPVVTVSYSYWTRRLASDSSAIGRDILVNPDQYAGGAVTKPHAPRRHERILAAAARAARAGRHVRAGKGWLHHAGTPDTHRAGRERHDRERDQGPPRGGVPRREGVLARPRLV